MIQNEFRFIGTIVSDFEEAGIQTFPKKKFLLEVEKKKGKVATYPIYVLDSNKVIDTSKSLFGCVVIVGGYVDVYKDYVTLVAQDITAIGIGGKPKVRPVEIKPENNNVVDTDKVLEAVPTNVEDDDLPF